MVIEHVKVPSILIWRIMQQQQFMRSLCCVSECHDCTCHSPPALQLLRIVSFSGGPVGITNSNVRAQRSQRSLPFWDKWQTNPLDSCKSSGHWRQSALQSTVADGAGLKEEGKRKVKLDNSLPLPGFKVHARPPPLAPALPHT